MDRIHNYLGMSRLKRLSMKLLAHGVKKREMDSLKVGGWGVWVCRGVLGWFVPWKVPAHPAACFLPGFCICAVQVGVVCLLAVLTADTDPLEVL
jgi:hypothetical protein